MRVREDSTTAVYCPGGGTGTVVSGAQIGDLAGRVGKDRLLRELIIPERGSGCSWYREHDVRRQTTNTAGELERLCQGFLQLVTTQTLDKPTNDSIKGNI